jgi:riboflavin synthase
MFTGIIEAEGRIKSIKKEGSNIVFVIESNISDELTIDQSLAHDGVCLTVVKQENGCHAVVAIDETLKRSALRSWQEGTVVNLERAMMLNDRLDGHIVQGHVDTVGEVLRVEEVDGSWNYFFSYKGDKDKITVPKGSITINGVSLTVVQSDRKGFSVSIIPYTYEHTNFRNLKKGSLVNLEFDIIGKYVSRLMEKY